MDLHTPNTYFEIARLGLIVAAVYFAVLVHLEKRLPVYGKALAPHRLLFLLFLAAAVVLSKVAEDVLNSESHDFDHAVLHFLHQHISQGWSGFFRLLTETGSSKVLLTITAGLALVLALRKLRTAALFLVLSVLMADFTVFCIKLLVGRERPALWETDWYWGSSFPSGHTVGATAFATAIALIVRRRRRAAYPYVLAIAAPWAALVGLSRMILGVHWPTDVAAAMCIGIIVPMTIAAIMQMLSMRAAAVP